MTDFSDGSIERSNPINDLNWVFNELIQWVFFNVMSKWESVVRKGQDKVRMMNIHQYYVIVFF